MRKLNLMRAPLCAAALLLYIGAEAQWPQRLDFAGLDDEAQATAVDRWGNVDVAGTITTTGDGKDFYVASYTAGGALRPNWPQRYDGPPTGSGSDDIATSIHVDPSSGNVYVGGTSYGGATSGFDFCVIAYNSGGQTVWPNSGGGTGYAYHNGALRTTSTLDEGAGQGSPGTATNVHVAMAVREDYSAENRVIAMTGIIAAGSAGDYWRTVVFEPSSAFPYNPVLKNGWPVDLNTDGIHGETPQAVAIYTDNSVYVTGQSSPGPGVEEFTTIRYKPTGNKSGTPYYWRHNWAPRPDFKPNSGMDIVLDRSGDAYATGYVLQDGLDYGTVAIGKDADASGNPQVKWTDIWESGFFTDERAKSVSLTYEVENGALVPFVYVTGTIETSGQIATLRYRSDTVPAGPEWAEIHTPNNGVAVGLDVVGAGYGNAYVIGRSNDDLVVIGYRRNGSVRLGPLFYHLVDLDEGRMGAMVGAGALVATGASDGSGTSADFVTQRFFQTTGASSPSSYLVQLGVYFGGGLSDLQASDDSYLVVRENLAAETDPSMRVQFTGAVAANNPTEIHIHFEGRSDANSTQEIELYDYLTTQWVLMDKRQSTFGDSRLALVVKEDPGRFLNAGEYKLRVSYRNPAAELVTWKVYFDLVSVDVLDG